MGCYLLRTYPDWTCFSALARITPSALQIMHCNAIEWIIYTLSTELSITIDSQCTLGCCNLCSNPCSRRDTIIVFRIIRACDNGWWVNTAAHIWVRTEKVNVSHRRKLYAAKWCYTVITTNSPFFKIFTVQHVSTIRFGIFGSKTRLLENEFHCTIINWLCSKRTFPKR